MSTTTSGSASARKGLPPISSPQFLQAVRNALNVALGMPTAPLDRNLTVRDLLAANLLSLPSNFGSGGDFSGLTLGLGVQGAYVVDKTAPPTPSNFAASAGITSIVMTTDPPTFTAGHGYARTKIYGAKYSGTGALPTFANAVEITEFTGAVTAYTTDPATEWHLWATWLTVDGVESVAPAGGVNGVTVTTGQNVASLLKALTSQLSTTQLDASLQSQISTFSAVTSGLATPASTALPLNTVGFLASSSDITLQALPAVYAQIANEQIVRQSAVEQLTQTINTLAVGTGVQFDSAQIWYFNALGGWTGTTTPVITSGSIEATDNADPTLTSPAGLNIDGTTYSQVFLRAQITGAPPWLGRLEWRLVGDASGTWRTTTNISQPIWDANGWATFEWISIPFGGIVDQIRVTLTSSQDATDFCVINWLAIGRPSPGASTAALQTEQTARVASDNALSQQITSLQATVGSNTSAIQSEATARANGDSSLSSQITSLQSTVNTNTANITSLQSAYATSSGTFAQQISALQAVTAPTVVNASSATPLNLSVNLASGNPVDVSQFMPALAQISYERDVRTSQTSSLAQQVSSLQATVNTNYTTLSSQIQTLSQSAATSAATNASAITTLQSQVGTANTNIASLQTSASTAANNIGELQAEYTVKVDLNGYVAGYGLASTSTTSGSATSQFIVRADSFLIGSPSGPGIVPAVPFLVQTTSGTANGQTYQPGVYMSSAFIQNGTITSAHIGLAAIDAANIASVNAASINAGAIAVGGYIESPNYIAGQQGWTINGNGTAEFAAASIRGQLLSSQIAAGAITTTQLAAGAVTATQIAAQTIDVTNIKVGAVSVPNLVSISTSTAVSAGNTQQVFPSVTSSAVNVGNGRRFLNVEFEVYWTVSNSPLQSGYTNLFTIYGYFEILVNNTVIKKVTVYENCVLTNLTYGPGANLTFTASATKSFIDDGTVIPSGSLTVTCASMYAVPFQGTYFGSGGTLTMTMDVGYVEVFV